MSCPPDLAEILARMLEMALLRIRSSLWAGQAERGAIEADHAHNLPGLIAHFYEDGLAYYWNVERPSYIERIGESNVESWQPLWHELGRHVGPSAEPAAAVGRQETV
jgi:hypothetical protein